VDEHITGVHPTLVDSLQKTSRRRLVIGVIIFLGVLALLVSNFLRNTDDHRFEEAMSNGEAHLEKGDYAKADVEFDKAFDIVHGEKGNDDKISQALAKSCITKKHLAEKLQKTDLSKAEGFWLMALGRCSKSQAIDLWPKYIHAHLWKAWQYAERSDWKGAENEIHRRWAARRPDLGEEYEADFNQAHLTVKIIGVKDRIKAKDWDGALKRYQDALNYHGQTEFGRLEEAAEAALDKAYQVLSAAIQSHAAAKETAGDYAAAGALYLLIRKYNEAVGAYGRAKDWVKVATIHKSQDAWKAAAAAYLKAGKLGESARMLGRAGDWRAAAKRFVEAGDYLEGGSAYVLAKMYTQAVDTWSKGKHFESIGNFYMKRREHLQAAAYFTKGKKWKGVGKAYLTAGMPDKALEAFTTGKLWVVLADYYSGKKDIGRAAGYYAQGKAWRLAGKAYLATKQLELAVAAFRKGKHWNELGEYYEKIGKLNAAGTSYEMDEELWDQALRIYRQAKNWKALGDLHVRLETLDSAAEAYEQGGLYTKSAEIYAGLAKSDPSLEAQLKAGRAFRKAGKSERAKVYFAPALKKAESTADYAMLLTVRDAMGELGTGVKSLLAVVATKQKSGEPHAAWRVLEKIAKHLSTVKDARARVSAETYVVMEWVVKQLTTEIKKYPEMDFIRYQTHTTKTSDEFTLFMRTFVEGKLINRSSRRIKSVVVRVYFFRKDIKKYARFFPGKGAAELSPESTSRFQKAKATYTEEIRVENIPPKGSKTFSQTFRDRVPYGEAEYELVKLKFEKTK
jgi:tetratricopeptide (TPR) repeat protein